MALFNLNYSYDREAERRRRAEREIGATLNELYEASRMPPVNAPTRTGMNVDLPQVQPMSELSMLTGLIRAGAFPNVTQNALLKQISPQLTDIGGEKGFPQKAYVTPYGEPRPIGQEMTRPITGGSEFERNMARYLYLEGKGDLTQAEKYEKDQLKKRVETRAGTGLSRAQEVTESRQQQKIKIGKEQRLVDEYKEDAEHFKNMEKSISGAMAAIEAGDNQLADQLLAQVMTQVNDTDVRAYQLITNMDQNFGNFAERVWRGAARWVGGGRTPEEKAEILETLKTFRDQHVDPGIRAIGRRYRIQAEGESLGPFDIVPPSSPEEIRDYPGMDEETKVKALKKWYPERFR